MKLIEILKQKIFIRDNNNNGFTIDLEGDATISGNLTNDKIIVWNGDDGSELGIIDLDVEMKDTNTYTNSWGDDPRTAVKITIIKKTK